MTRYSKIVNMNIDELAQWLDAIIGDCKCCVYNDDDCTGYCMRGIREWLMEESNND